MAGVSLLMAQKPLLTSLRSHGCDAAILLIHGFNADPQSTWGEFPRLLMEHSTLQGFDLHSLGYRTGLMPDLRGVWSGDPDLQTLATFLYTACAHPPLSRYSALVLLAHSMGGLVVQRALLDHVDLAGRTSHLLLFATPSNGLTKAGWVRWAKPQARDMDAGGPFVRQLRNDWRQRPVRACGFIP